MKFKKLAAVLAAAMMLSTGVVPVMAAETVSVEPTAHQVMEIQEAIESDVEIQKEIQALAAEVETEANEFDWSDLEVGQTGNLLEMAFKTDLESESMAGNALPGGSTVTRQEDGYCFTIKTKGFSMMGMTAEPKTVSVTYYDAYGEEITDTAVLVETDDGTYDVTFVIPNDAQGMYPDGAAADYANMIKVKMTTTLEDNWLGGLFPEAMKNPTFFYAFNVVTE